MNAKHVYFAMIGCLVLLVGAIGGGTYLANQELVKQSRKLQDYKTQAEVVSREQAGLAKAKKDVARYTELEKIAKTIVPQDKDQARAVREIVNIAGAAGVKLTAVNFPASNLGSKVPTAAAGGAAAPKADTGSALSQLKPIKDLSGVYNLQITVQADPNSPVPFDKFLDFLKRLENNRRTAQVTSIVLQPQTANRNLVSFTLTIDEFIKP
jgi:hypothetical protein